MGENVRGGWGLDGILTDILGAGERIFGRKLDYDLRRDSLNAMSDADERRYQRRYSGGSYGGGFYGDDGASMLPMLLIGGVVLVGAVLLARA